MVSSSWLFWRSWLLTWDREGGVCCILWHTAFEFNASFWDLLCQWRRGIKKKDNGVLCITIMFSSCTMPLVSKVWYITRSDKWYAIGWGFGPCWKHVGPCAIYRACDIPDCVTARSFLWHIYTAWCILGLLYKGHVTHQTLLKKASLAQRTVADLFQPSKLNWIGVGK